MGASNTLDFVKMQLPDLKLIATGVIFDSLKLSNEEILYFKQLGLRLNQICVPMGLG